MEIHKDLNGIKIITVLSAIEHDCTYYIIILNHVNYAFDAEKSTYEFVRKSYFEKERSNVLAIHTTDQLLEQREEHFDAGYLKIIRDKEIEMGRVKALSEEYAKEPTHQMRFVLPEKARESSPFQKEMEIKYHLKPGEKLELKINRNDPCLCKSGKKWKNCCLK